MPVAALRWPDKDPADVLDYAMDFADFLASPIDTIASVVWTVPAGLTAGTQYNVSGVATVWLSAGAAGTDYAITARVITAGGRTIERSAALYVRDL
jgi:hypothetical protein